MDRETEFDNRQPEDCAPSGTPREIADLNRPFWELGGQERGSADLIRQDGYIYGWSESNIRYELLGQAGETTGRGRYYSQSGIRVPDYAAITRSISGGR